MLTEVTISVPTSVYHEAVREAQRRRQPLDALLREKLEAAFAPPDDPLHAAIHCERVAFDALLPELLLSHAGQYVAVYNGQVVDHDPDLRTLSQRIHTRLGHVPVLLKRVTHEPDRELVFRSPRRERVRP